jgi:tricarballylate dehydrogenase
MTQTDVVVVGAGNAGLVAALAAHEAGARVIVLEAAGEDERGGNSRFSGGIFRAAHDGLDSIRPLLSESDEEVFPKVSVAPYPGWRYREDWLASSMGRPPHELVDTVIDDSFETLGWMRRQGVEWELTADKLFDLDKLGGVYQLPPGGAIRD